MQEKNNLSELFKQMGGDQAVAKLFDVSTLTVERWRSKGVPDRYHEQILDLCETHGVPAMTLEQMKYPRLEQHG